MKRFAVAINKLLFLDVKKLAQLREYTDMRLLAQLLSDSVRISFLLRRNRWKALLAMANPKKAKGNNTDRDTMFRYFNFCLEMRRRFMLEDSCFHHSVLLCRCLRKNGVNARLNFGAKKQEKQKGTMSLAGHCWVTVEGDPRPTAADSSADLADKFLLLYTYPS